jgi:hypothetical protein
MKPYLALVFAPLLVQCGSSSASHGSSNDSGADVAGDGGEDATSSGSGGVTDGGSSSGADGASGSSGSGSGGGDGAIQTACETAMTPAHLTYTVGSAGGSDVITLSFDVDATWGQRTPMPAPWWSVFAGGSTCEFTPGAELRLGGTIAGDAGADGGVSLPATAATWTISGHDYPQSASDAAIWLGEHVDRSSGTGNYWLSKSGTITGMPVGTGCYELDFTNVPFATDPGMHNPSINQATGSFVATGMARVGAGCP